MTFLKRYFRQGTLGDMLYVAAGNLLTAVGGTKAAGRGPVIQGDGTVAWQDVASFGAQSANTVYAGPATGAPATPGFRVLAAADIPNLDAAKITTGIIAMARLASGTPDGTKFVRDDGTLATPAVGSVGWRTELTRNLTLTVGDTVELGSFGVVSGTVVITAKWNQSNAVSTRRWTVPFAYNITGGAFQLVKPDYNPSSGSADLGLEVNVGTTTTTFRFVRTATGSSVGTLGLAVTVEFTGGTAPAFTPSSTTSTSAVTAFISNSTRFNPAALAQNGAADRQPLSWNNTTGQWEPMNPWQTWRFELSRTITTTIDSTVELGSWNVPNGRYRVTAAWNQSNGVHTKSWELVTFWNATSGNWLIVLPAMSTVTAGADDFHLEVNVDSSNTKFRFRRTVVGGAGTLNPVQVSVEHMGDNLPTFTASTTTSTSAVTALYDWRYLLSVLGSSGAGHGATVQYDSAANKWVPANATPNTQTGASYTLVLNDALRHLEMNNAGANTLTVPTNATVPFIVGTVIPVTMIGSGVTTIAAAVGVTIRVPSGLSLTMVQYQTLRLRKRAADEWVLSN